LASKSQVKHKEKIIIFNCMQLFVDEIRCVYIINLFFKNTECINSLIKMQNLMQRQILKCLVVTCLRQIIGENIFLFSICYAYIINYSLLFLNHGMYRIYLKMKIKNYLQPHYFKRSETANFTEDKLCE